MEEVDRFDESENGDDAAMWFEDDEEEEEDEGLRPADCGD